MYSMHIYYKEYLSHIHMQLPLDLQCLQLMFSYHFITQESIQFSNHLSLSFSFFPSVLFPLSLSGASFISSDSHVLIPSLVQVTITTLLQSKQTTTKCATKYLYNVINYAQMLLNVKQKQNTKAFNLKFRTLTK